MVRFIIPYSSYTPEEILLKCARREITPADTIDALETRRDFYRRAIRGQLKDCDLPITPEEAAEKIGAEENAIETLQAILDPPVFTINSTEIRNQLREIRNRCIAGGCTKKAALALFDQTWLDFKKDTISKANKFCKDIVGRPAIINSQVGQIIDECKDMDIINEIRVEIEGIPESSPPESAPNTQVPERKVTLPPVIQAVLNEGLLDTPVNGKYPKKGDKKDTEIIEWIFDYSGYGDSLTTELYMQYIQTHCKSTTIQDYITRNKKPPD
jgi:hypothetical protein